MKKILSLILTVVMLVSISSVLMTGCSSGGDNTLNVLTWAEYISPDVAAKFEQETGVKINYTFFESNEEMLMKLEASNGGDYDVVLASDYVIDIANKQGLTQKLDKSIVSNHGNIHEWFLSPYYDANNEYTVPYAAGIPLIVYDPAKVGFEITGYEDLWNESLKDSIVVLDDARNMIGITLKSMGHSLNTTDADVLAKAEEKLALLKPNIRAFDYNMPQNLVISGEVSVGYMFTSQVALALFERPDLKVAYPKEGLGFGIDAFFIPSNAPHAENANKFLNYFLDPANADFISEYTLYFNCITGASPYGEGDTTELDILMKDAEYMKDVGDITETYHDIWRRFKQ